jgi:hypothetical protein
LLSRVTLSNYNLNIAKAVPREEIEQTLINFSKENANAREAYLKNNQFGYYLAGLLEGDGHISLPAVSNTTLNRVLNPRIVFTSPLGPHLQNKILMGPLRGHKNNLGLFCDLIVKVPSAKISVGQPRYLHTSNSSSNTQLVV